MLKRALAVLLVILLIAGGLGWWWLHRWPSAPQVKVLEQPDGRLLTMAAPKGEPHARVVLATPSDLQLADADLLGLATNAVSNVVGTATSAVGDAAQSGGLQNGLTGTTGGEWRHDWVNLTPYAGSPGMTSPERQSLDVTTLERRANRTAIAMSKNKKGVLH